MQIFLNIIRLSEQLHLLLHLGHRLQHPALIGGLLHGIQQHLPGGGDGRRGLDAHHQRGGARQAAQVRQAGGQQPPALGEVHALIVEGRQKIEQHGRGAVGGRLLQQRLQLEAGEGARERDAPQGVVQFWGQPAQRLCHRVHVEAVATIQHAEGAIVCQARRQLQHERVGGMRRYHQQDLVFQRARQRREPARVAQGGVVEFGHGSII